MTHKKGKGGKGKAKGKGKGKSSKGKGSNSLAKGMTRLSMKSGAATAPKLPLELVRDILELVVASPHCSQADLARLMPVFKDQAWRDKVEAALWSQLVVHAWQRVVVVSGDGIDIDSDESDAGESENSMRFVISGQLARLLKKPELGKHVKSLVVLDLYQHFGPHQGAHTKNVLRHLPNLKRIDQHLHDDYLGEEIIRLAKQRGIKLEHVLLATESVDRDDEYSYADFFISRRSSDPNSWYASLLTPTVPDDVARARAEQALPASILCDHPRRGKKKELCTVALSINYSTEYGDDDELDEFAYAGAITTLTDSLGSAALAPHRLVFLRPVPWAVATSIYRGALSSTIHTSTGSLVELQLPISLRIVDDKRLDCSPAPGPPALNEDNHAPELVDLVLWIESVYELKGKSDGNTGEMLQYWKPARLRTLTFDFFRTPLDSDAGMSDDYSDSDDYDDDENSYHGGNQRTEAKPGPKEADGKAVADLALSTFERMYKSAPALDQLAHDVVSHLVNLEVLRMPPVPENKLDEARSLVRSHPVLGPWADKHELLIKPFRPQGYFYP